MHYAGQFTVSSSATSEKPSTLDIDVVQGILHSGVFFFPAGHRMTVHIALYHAIHQIWPTNPSGTMAFENYTHQVNDYYLLPPGVTKLRLKGYSVNADNSHKIQWAFSINSPEEVFPMLFGPMAHIEDIAKILAHWFPQQTGVVEGSE